MPGIHRERPGADAITAANGGNRHEARCPLIAAGRRRPLPVKEVPPLPHGLVIDRERNVKRSRQAADFMVISDGETVFENTLPIPICDSLHFVTPLLPFFFQGARFRAECVVRTSVSPEFAFRECRHSPGRKR